jgi:hypothetical protein
MQARKKQIPISKYHFDLALQLRRVRLHQLQTAIHNEPSFIRLDHQSSGSGSHQRAEHPDQSDFGHAAVFQVESGTEF